MAVAIILIAAGLIWLFNQAAGFPFFNNLHMHHYYFPFRNAASGITDILFSWQMVFIVTGTVLLAGRRSSGIVLLATGVVFMLSKLMHFTFWSLTFLLPALLITIGIIMVVKAAHKR